MSDSSETPSSSSNSSSPSPSPPSTTQPPSDSNSTSPPPSSDKSNSPSSPTPPPQTQPPSPPQQLPSPSQPPPAPAPSPPPKSPPLSPPPKSSPLSPPPQAPPPSSTPQASPPSSTPQAPPPSSTPQSTPPTPPPQTPAPSSSTQTPAPTSTPPAPPTGQQKHAPAPSPNGNGNGSGNSSPPPAVSSPPPTEETGNPPSRTQSPPTAQVAPAPTGNGGDNSSPDTGLVAPTGSPYRSYPPSRHPPSPPAESTSHTTGNSNENSESSGSKNQETTKIVTGVAVSGAVVIVIVAVLFLLINRRKKKATNVYAANGEGDVYGKQIGIENLGLQGHHSSGSNVSQRRNMYPGPFNEPIGNSQVAFTYEKMSEITNRFSPQNVIGGGGFGPVYKGFLPDGRPVAVKQLKAGSGQGEREFRAEVEIISRVHHRHLVSLVGYCIYEEQRLLIYEFVPNNILQHHLHGNGMPVLEWSKRLRIAIGAAKGLSYLHDDCHPKIIHRDIKSSNILLDDAFEAKVADFGLAKLTNDAHTHVSTRVMGTFGYMAPEYASSGKLTDKSDVFSFGVVLLELITGRKPVDQNQPIGDESLVEWARPYLINAIETRDLSRLADPRLEGNYVEDEMFRMIEAAAACIRHSAPKRPRLVQVMRALDSEAEANDLSNGCKYGQSTVYRSGQFNQDILRFRQMIQDSSEFDMSSGENISGDSSQVQ